MEAFYKNIFHRYVSLCHNRCSLKWFYKVLHLGHSTTTTAKKKTPSNLFCLVINTDKFPHTFCSQENRYKHEMPTCYQQEKETVHLKRPWEALKLLNSFHVIPKYSSSNLPVKSRRFLFIKHILGINKSGRRNILEKTQVSTRYSAQTHL